MRLVFVLNSGPSIWPAFHVIGKAFDKTVIEGQLGHDAQTVEPPAGRRASGWQAGLVVTQREQEEAARSAGRGGEPRAR